MLVFRRAFQGSFGEDPEVGIRLTVSQGDRVLHSEDKYSAVWYSDATATKTCGGAASYGWRYSPCPAPLILKPA